MTWVVKVATEIMREDMDMPDDDIPVSDLIKTLLGAALLVVGALLYLLGDALADVTERLVKEPSPTQEQDNAIRKALDRYGR